MDPYCCDTGWDEACTNVAYEFCFSCGAGCGVGNPNSCCTAHAATGCSDAACCNAVCAVDSLCCVVQWDDLCASEAASTCALCGDACGVGSSGNCCTTHSNPGCANATCCTAVCDADSFCCTTSWDSNCVSEAATLCYSCGAACGAGNPQHCCVSHFGVGCGNPACCDAVCAMDAACCATMWDALCASIALSVCPICACSAANPDSCCEAHPGLGCGDSSCCLAVCGVDSFCCNVSWDNDCAQEAAQLCESCHPPCPADLNGDGQVNGADLGILLGNWGCSGAGCGGDLDGNQSVNGADLGILLGNWGPCP